ncbi:MAG TPA: GNAT family N-acetyltransferase [Candidatus Saccharimonadales bacterium]|nr:GNAT family N-acetyltransferase [Candidatus Saccharimonadales bacterium]
MNAQSKEFPGMSAGKPNAPSERSGIAVRKIEDVEEMRICIDLQQNIWGYSDLDTVPEQMCVVAKKTGGQVMAAFDGARPVGFALAYAAMHDGHAYLHSHMVGVLREYQDRGVGRLLKLAQRDDALARGINRIEWTFDPLQLKNARFNIARLGAIVRHFIPNLYGRTSSPLHAGLPTDRLVAEWWVGSTRVRDILSGVPAIPLPASARVSIPKEIREICLSEPQKAEALQSEARAKFQEYFTRGYAAVGFEFSANEGSYLLEPYED